MRREIHDALPRRIGAGKQGEYEEQQEHRARRTRGAE